MSGKVCLGIFVLGLVVCLWVGSSELTKFIFENENYSKPFFSTYFKTSLFSVYLFGFIYPSWRERCRKLQKNYVQAEVVGPSLGSPSLVPTHDISSSRDTESEAPNYEEHLKERNVKFNHLTEVRHLPESEAGEALAARLSQAAWERYENDRKMREQRFPVSKIAQLSLGFGVVWFLANYCYQLALVFSSPSIVNIASSASGVFTLILASIFPSGPNDHFTVSKLLITLLNAAGVVVISLEGNLSAKKIPVGLLLALASSIFYAVYLVLLRKFSPSEDALNIPMFFGFVGLFTLISMWLGLFLLNYTGWEVFQIPNKQQLVTLLLNGLLGTVVSEFLWLWSCFLTSSLAATLALSLTIPLTMAADFVLFKKYYTWTLYVGSVPIFLACLFATIFSYYPDWDPVLDLVKKLFFCCKGRSQSTPGIANRRPPEAQDTDSLQQPLLSSDSDI